MLITGPGMAAQVSNNEDRRASPTDSRYVNIGYSKGYEAGYPLGQRDGQEGERADPQRHTAYRQRSEGYDPSAGARSQYEESYRVGFEDAYQDGYHRFDRRVDQEGPSSIRYQDAFARGYKEGFNHGRQDGRSKKHYDFAHAKAYQKADLGYKDQQFPSRADYQLNFRQGYEAGYDDGYNNRTYTDQRQGPRTYSSRRPDASRQRGDRDGGYDRPGTGRADYRAADPSAIPEGTTLHLKMNNTLSTRSTQQGDSFTAQVIDPINVGNAVAIPDRSTVHGVVTRVVRAGRAGGKAELHMRFDKLVLPNDRTYQLNASVTSLDAQNKAHVGEEGTMTGSSTTKRTVGEVAIGTGIGALIGAIAGGGKGAAIGAGVGAGGGTAAALMSHGHEVDLPQGSDLTIKLNRPLLEGPR